MLNNLLWFLEAKQQHDRQREAGLAGLVFLVLTFLAVLKWDEWIYPTLEWSGLVGLAERVGLITDSAHTTMFNVVGMILFFVFAYAILAFILTMLMLLIPALLTSKVGIFVITVIFGPLLFLLTMTFGRFWYKKKDAPKNEVQINKYVRAFQEKEKAKYESWLERFNNAPDIDKDGTNSKQMLGYERSLWGLTPADDAHVNTELPSFRAWTSYLRDIEPQLDLYRDNVIIFNKETGKFSFVFPNPLPVTVSAMYNKPFEREEVLLEALHLYKDKHQPIDEHVFPTLELEVINTLERSFLSPVKDAEITPLKITDSDMNYKKYHVLHHFNFYTTIEELNKRKDVQTLLDRVNLNALLLQEIVDTHGITAQTTSNLSNKISAFEMKKELYSSQLTAAINQLNYAGYKWR